MTVKIVRIGNSRGLRLPRELLETYGLQEGDVVEIEQRREGFLVHPVADSAGKVSYEESYRQIALEAAEHAEWDDWDGVAGDGDP
ncbi:MAG: AbrB/MazE/SpoVT family DNA-binding domain-containing protein [Alkalispirochaeta sp.]